jgi:hypothetical protein
MFRSDPGHWFDKRVAIDISLAIIVHMTAGGARHD